MRGKNSGAMATGAVQTRSSGNASVKVITVTILAMNKAKQTSRKGFCRGAMRTWCRPARRMIARAVRMATDTVECTAETAYSADTAVHVLAVTFKTGTGTGDVGCRMLTAGIGNSPSGRMLTRNRIDCRRLIVSLAATNKYYYQTENGAVSQQSHIGLLSMVAVIAELVIGTSMAAVTTRRV
jgi:hypothetical protein